MEILTHISVGIERVEEDQLDTYFSFMLLTNRAVLYKIPNTDFHVLPIENQLGRDTQFFEYLHEWSMDIGDDGRNQREQLARRYTSPLYVTRPSIKPQLVSTALE